MRIFIVGMVELDMDETVKEQPMIREACTSTKLQGICLSFLKSCPGFEHVNEILIQPRDSFEGGTNWTVAAVRPRVSNTVLRAARGTIEMLQTTYELNAGDVNAIQQARRAAAMR